MNSVLGIIGSPIKNGNTSILVNKILEGSKSKNPEYRQFILESIRLRNAMAVMLVGRDKIALKMMT